MEQGQVIVNHKKQRILKVGSIFFVILILFTFLSQSLYNYLLPTVTVEQPKKGSLVERLKVVGRVEPTETSDIIATGNWRVLEVLSKEGRKVNVGEVIAIVEDPNWHLNVKRKELEVIQLENELDGLRQQANQGETSSAEVELLFAKKDMEEARRKKEQIQLLYDNQSVSKEEWQRAVRNYDDQVLRYETKRESYTSNQKESQRARSTLTKDILEKSLRLEVAREELVQLQNSFPENGEIKSTVDGKLISFSLVKGEKVQTNDKVATIMEKDVLYKVIFTANAGAGSPFNLGMKTSLVFKSKATGSMMVVPSPITEKRYHVEQDQYIFETIIEDKKLDVFNGQKVTVTANKVSAPYDMIIPKSAIKKVENRDVVFVIREKRGAFGIKKYVEKIGVDLLDSDDQNVAISKKLKRSDEVVITSTKFLTDGIDVKLR